jgi:hypothetical protein
MRSSEIISIKKRRSKLQVKDEPMVICQKSKFSITRPLLYSSTMKERDFFRAKKKKLFVRGKLN